MREQYQQYQILACETETDVDTPPLLDTTTSSDYLAAGRQLLAWCLATEAMPPTHALQGYYSRSKGSPLPAESVADAIPNYVPESVQGRVRGSLVLDRELDSVLSRPLHSMLLQQPPSRTRLRGLVGAGSRTEAGELESEGGVEENEGGVYMELKESMRAVA